MNLETEGKISQAVPNFLKHYYFRSSHLRCSVKKVFLEISQNSQKNTCTRDSFLIKLQARPKNAFYTEHLRTTFLLSIAKFTSIPQQVIDLTKKLRKNKKTERNETHAIK